MKTSSGREYSCVQRARIISVILGSLIALVLITHTQIKGTAIAANKPPVKPEITCPYTGDPAAIAQGRSLFYRNCAECHGDGDGGSGPDLTDNEWYCGGSDYQIFETVLKGRQGGMPSWSGDLSDDEIWKIVAFIRSIKK